MDLTGVLPISESGAERLAEGDHIGEDGLVYCGKCGSRKQLRVKFGDKTHVVRCVCKCESKELEEKKRQRKVGVPAGFPKERQDTTKAWATPWRTWMKKSERAQVLQKKRRPVKKNQLRKMT